MRAWTYIIKNEFIIFLDKGMSNPGALFNPATTADQEKIPAAEVIKSCRYDGDMKSDALIKNLKINDYYPKIYKNDSIKWLDLSHLETQEELDSYLLGNFDAYLGVYKRKVHPMYRYTRFTLDNFAKLEMYPTLSPTVYCLVNTPKDPTVYHLLTRKHRINVHRAMTRETIESIFSVKYLEYFDSYMNCVRLEIAKKESQNLSHGQLTDALQNEYTAWLLDQILEEWLKIAEGVYAPRK